MKSDNQGLTFIWIPNLFSKIPGGSFFLALFFLALSFAAFSSLISMLELDTRILMDAGLSRKKSIVVIGTCAFLLGLPSALSMGFFNNQDWVWSLGLLVSGLFLTIAVIKFGTNKFRREVILSSKNHSLLGKFFSIIIIVFLPLQFLAMISWFFWTSYTEDPNNWFKIFSSSSAGTVLFQWIIAIGVFIFLNKTISKKILSHNDH